ncbi:MAG: hypothetical protein AB1449_10235 [Chloroflexota bacterium]
MGLSAHPEHSTEPSAAAPADQAAELRAILARRLALGEITPQQYDEIVQVLGLTPDVPASEHAHH